MAVQELRFEREPAAEEPAGAGTLGGGTLDDRVARLEVAVEGLRGDVRGLQHSQAALQHSQNITTGALIGVGAVLLTAILFFGGYGLSRLNRLPS